MTLPIIDATLPVHDVAPSKRKVIAWGAGGSKKLGIKVETIIQRVAELHEFNPMLGHRGCRLGVTYPPRKRHL